MKILWIILVSLAGGTFGAALSEFIKRFRRAKMFSFPISPTDSAGMLELKEELTSIEKCLAYSGSTEERETWRKKYKEVSHSHAVQLERILKQYLPPGFEQELGANCGVDWINDKVFAQGWMRRG